MNFAVTILTGIWAFASFTVAAAGGLFRGRDRSRDLPQTRHPRTCHPAGIVDEAA